MAMTLNEFKKSTFKNAWYFKEIKTDADLNNLRNEIRELTNNGSEESIYELAQMESFDPDDIRKLMS
jgi:hypothetical protein